MCCQNLELFIAQLRLSDRDVKKDLTKRNKTLITSTTEKLFLIKVHSYNPSEKRSRKKNNVEKTNEIEQ